MQPPLQNDDLDLEAAVASACPQLVEFLSHHPNWLLTTSRRFLPEVALSGLDGITDHKEKVSVLLDLLEKAGPATWKQFAQHLCMDCDLPLDLEILLLSFAGEDTLSQEQEACRDVSACSSVPKGFARCRHDRGSVSDKDVKRQRLDSPEKYRHLLIKSICQRYGSRRPAAAQEQTQPLAFNQAFVNLIIQQSKAFRLKEKTDKSREDVAGAPEPEEHVDTAMKMSDLFCNVVPSGTTKVIFLFGKPGTGKTMLMHRICQKWAEGALPQFLFAFLFEFRQLNLLKTKFTLKEFLFDLFLQPEDSPDAVFQYLLENAWRTLIIFDGLDEFAANMDVSSSSRGGPALTSRMSISELFADLCRGKLLPGCTVLVTSRPKRLPNFLLNTVGLLAEVRGFDHEKVEEYVGHYFRQHSFKEQAIAHLKNNTKLLSMCLIPALCNVVCICLEYLLLKHQTSVELPQTMTQFYIKMLLIFINKQQGECAGGEETQLNCNKEAILGLCHLALKGLEDKKLVFYVDDIPEHVKEFASLHGLLTVFEVKTSGTCPEVGYAFVHLSLQEFFAALCLMVSKRVDKNYLKKKFSLKSKWNLKNEAKTEFMESFHIFLSGLSSKECRTFLMLLAEQDEAWVQDKQDTILQSLKKLAATRLTGPKVIELCHCTFETQDLKVAQHIGSMLSVKYRFKNFRLTPLDVAALVFVINLGPDLSELDFAGCLVDVDCLELLAGCKNIEHLSFHSRRCGNDFAAALSKSLRGMESLKKLELTGGSITAEGMTDLIQASSQCLQLEEINLQDNWIRDPEVKRVMDLFSRMEKLKKIDLSNNDLSLNAVVVLAKEVIACQNATELHVRRNTVILYFSGPSGKVPRSLDLKWEENKEHIIPTRCVKLCLQDCSLSSQHVKEIVAILQSCPCLSEVDLSGNNLGDEGCSYLLESLPWISISEQLDLSQNRLSVNGICSLLKSVNTCQTMIEVQVSLCREIAVLRFSGDREFASHPPREEPVLSADGQRYGEENQMPTTSPKIRLTDSHFQASDLEKLCAVLKECSSISELDLSRNHLGDEGLQMLQFLPDLKMLSSLKLNDNQISLNSVFFLAQSLSTLEHVKTMNFSLGHTQVVHLTFWERIRGRSTSRWRSSFPAYPKHDAKGQCFCLRDCRVSPEDMTRLCQILAQYPQLTEIDLCGNSLSDQSIEKLLRFLPYLCHLKLLSIRNNMFSPHCTVLLINSINLCERITIVEVRSSENALLHLGASMQSRKTSCRLTDCAIGQGQIDELCRVLEQRGWLAEVDLSRNQLGDEGLRCFLDHLHQVPVTCSLNLSHNRISQDGVLHLINAFATSGNTSEVQVSLCSKATLIIKLTSRDDPRKILRLAECNFQPEHLEKLCLLLEKCTGLTEYISSNNNVTVQAAERLLLSLRKNLHPLKISIEEPWVCEESVMNLLELAVQACGNITEITICKDKTLFQLGVRFPHCPEKVESVVSRLNLYEPEIKHACFYRRVCEKCAQLQELRWSHVELHNDEAEMLVRILLPLPELKRFGLTSSSITPTGIDYLIMGLQNCQAIEELNLGYMKLSSAAISKLALGLHGMPFLKKLILNHNSIGDDGCSRLTEALRNMHYMEEINLSHNKIGDPGLINLAAVLMEKQNLKRVDLSGNSPSPAGGKKLMEAFAYCKHIEELLLSRNGFGDGTVMKLALCLPHMTNLKILHLQNNNIGPAGGMELARALVACGLLEEISLSENDLGEGSIHALSKGLPCFEHLRRIDLKLCGITDDASKSLSHGFQQCPSVEEIILSWNALGDGGAQELASALPGMEKLKMLDLEKNRIGACGATKLAEELAKCPEIQFVRLWDNPVPKGLAENLTSQDPRLCFSFYQ
ncbi:protein NLRC5 isoform X1 [Falco biarmicus]|uniref:protein NLRC5 isoform X2 n=1 Tax=Falco rusticolus TaxID=120794 RepID=UPI0018868715|nr:protein NLRC5 isoform X2 [Falco rusticolus]XP_037264683.1 protein NLRC5 isoform X2 [Falco rusticolus]XP_055582409.1 protein NLRC5 isoform X1 [Falco cherrug]XP_055582410.1 protein NLRC5 isoform X1 [Falco cherrug]XP_056216210.1 protein NLRC5 isoform X1 [Falco biarmicus]XP_056216211.1 protein NLRC5 isoform X1 [Falco biarmicus]